MLQPPGLDQLITALREAGIHVGFAELARLREVFHRAPQPLEDQNDSARRLRSLIASVVLKSGADRELLDRIFDAWFSAADDKETDRSITPPKPTSIHTPERSLARRNVLIALGIAGIALILALAASFLIDTDPPTPAGEPTPTPAPAPTARPDQPIDRGVRSAWQYRQLSFSVQIPAITIHPSQPSWQGWPAIGLAIISLATAIGLWLAKRRIQIEPQPTLPVSSGGPPRLFLRTSAAQVSLLDADDEESLVWGVGRFVTEESTRKLDATASVRATARSAGIPQVVFEPAKFHREVWLWIDRSSTDPTIVELAESVSRLLKGSGLPVRQAEFYGIPERLTSPDGAVFAPRELDEHRDGATVLVLTDGRMLAHQYEADDRRIVIDSLLRDLSLWRHVCFVDFSDQHNQLRLMLDRFTLAAVAPSDLAASVRAGSADRSRSFQPPRPETRDEAVWAASCALSPGPIDDATALDLRLSLELGCSRWALRAFHSEAPGPGQRLHWPGHRKIHRLNWLSQCEVITPKNLHSSDLGRALAYWEHRYETELEALTHDPLLADSLGFQHTVMERELLRLWHDPERAAEKLAELWPGPLRAELETELGSLAPSDCGNVASHVVLPWAWQDQPPRAKALLQSMGLGGGLRPIQLKRPGRLWLGLGLCLGCAIGAAVAAMTARVVAPDEEPTVVHTGSVPADAETRTILEQSSPDSWRLTILGAADTAIAGAGPGSLIVIDWRTVDRSAVLTTDLGAELWLKNPAVTGLPNVVRSLVALEAELSDPAAESLAVALLESGTADQVLIDPDWPASQELLLGGSEAAHDTEQMLVVTRDNLNETAVPDGACGLAFTSWSDVIQGLDFDGIKNLNEVWGQRASAMAGAAQCRVRGPSRVLIDPITGMRLRYIKPGTFMMGSPPTEPGRDDDELHHEVTISRGFWIGETEVTQDQWIEIMGGQNPSSNTKCGADCPVETVSWFDAIEFTNKLSERSGLQQCYERDGEQVTFVGFDCNGYRLPTAAEWEFAARAGTDTPWSFGDNPDDIGSYAWFDGNSGYETHQVATKLANPWGLYDMHGNVLEWCWSWYGPYDPEQRNDPLAPIFAHRSRSSHRLSTELSLRIRSFVSRGL